MPPMISFAVIVSIGNTGPISEGNTLYASISPVSYSTDRATVITSLDDVVDSFNDSNACGGNMCNGPDGRKLLEIRSLATSRNTSCLLKILTTSTTCTSSSPVSGDKEKASSKKDAYLLSA